VSITRTPARTLDRTPDLALDEDEEDTKAMAGRHQDRLNPSVAEDAMAKTCEINNMNDRENDALRRRMKSICTTNLKHSFATKFAAI